MADIKKKMRKNSACCDFCHNRFFDFACDHVRCFSGIFILQKLGFNLVDEISKVPLLHICHSQRQRRYSAGFSVQQAASETD